MGQRKPPVPRSYWQSPQSFRSPKDEKWGLIDGILAGFALASFSLMIAVAIYQTVTGVVIT